MKLKSRTRSALSHSHEASLPLTSLVDVFAILVIFLLANSQSLAQWLSSAMTLPTAQTGEAYHEDFTLEIGLGKLKCAGQTLDTSGNWNDPHYRAALQDKLLPLLKSHSEKSEGLTLLADAHLPYGQIRQLLRLVRNEGRSHLQLAVAH